MIYRDGKPYPEPIKIEHNVPIPPRKGISLVADAARSMKIGDSIVMPYSRKPVAGNMEKVTGFKFTQRREGGNLRIWRIK